MVTVAHSMSTTSAAIAHRHQRLDDILALLAETPMHIPQMVDPLYPDLDPRLIGGARLSILASLRYLMANGAVEASGETPMQCTYRRVA